jgi:tRNA-dihydrouridine synthase
LPSVQDYLPLIQEQRRYLEEIFPERLSLVHARKFLSWYATGFPGCHAFRAQLFKLTDPEMVWKEAYRFFEDAGKQRSYEYMTQPFLMGGHG